jgi:hypothetical protein
MLLAHPVFAADIVTQGSIAELKEPAETVRFQLYNGYLIVAHGSMDGKKVNLLLDTGATAAILDAKLASKLHLHSEDAPGIVRLDRRTPAGETILPSLEIGPLHRTNLRVMTADLSFYEKVLPAHIDAVVGLDVLGQRPFVIDYPGRVIRFEPVPVLQVSVPLRIDQGLAVFDAEIDHAPVHLLLDTGAGFMTLFNKTERYAPSSDRKVWLSTLRLGAEEFGQKPALLTRNPKPSQIDFDGLMSPAALGFSQVAIDMQAGVLAFSR